VTGSGFGAVPEKVREVGQQVVQISQDVGSIVSSGAATIQLAGSGNAGFLATPAMAALTRRTGESKVDGPGTAATIAARVASRADFGHLGPVEREVIDRVNAPTGIIGSEGLAEWTRRQQGG
jgi:hypothetical protein